MSLKIEVDRAPVVGGTGPSGQAEDLQMLCVRLAAVLQTAYDQGFVITVELEPLQELAMRNYRMNGHIRAAR